MRAFLNSFVCAARGVWQAICKERNLRFHLCAAFYVYLFSLFYPFEKLEYIVLTLIIAVVLAAELFNSCIERLVDWLHPETNKTAGLVKDIAAGAVLVACIGALACGVWLFWDLSVLQMIGRFFLLQPVNILLLAVSLALSIWFIFFFGRCPHGKKN